MDDLVYGFTAFFGMIFIFGFVAVLISGAIKLISLAWAAVLEVITAARHMIRNVRSGKAGI